MDKPENNSNVSENFFNFKSFTFVTFPYLRISSCIYCTKGSSCSWILQMWIGSGLTKGLKTLSTFEYAAAWIFEKQGKFSEDSWSNKWFSYDYVVSVHQTMSVNGNRESIFDLMLNVANVWFNLNIPLFDDNLSFCLIYRKKVRHFTSIFSATKNSPWQPGKERTPASFWSADWIPDRHNSKTLKVCSLYTFRFWLNVH